MKCSKISILKTNKTIPWGFFSPAICHLGCKDPLLDDEGQNHAERKQWACGTTSSIKGEHHKPDSWCIWRQLPGWNHVQYTLRWLCLSRDLDQNYPFCDSVMVTSHVLSTSEQLWLYFLQIFRDLVDCLKTRSCSWAQDNFALSSEWHLSTSWPMQCYPASNPETDYCVGVIITGELLGAGEPQTIYH